jgi:hypothetical protein
LSALRAAATIRGALGVDGPRLPHRVAALLRRAAALVVILGLALLALSGTALADGRDILADYEDNGRIDSCYTRAEFRDALRLLRDDQRQYGNAADAVPQAEITHVAHPGEPCGAARTAPAVAVDDGSGPASMVWLGVVGVVVVGAVGGGVWARRGSGDEPGE